MSWRRPDDDTSPPAGAHWITLSNHRRVLIDDEGRIVRGLPGSFNRVHVADVSLLGRRLRNTEDEEQQCEAHVRGRRARTFRSVEDGVRALLEVNPALFEYLEQECSHDCEQRKNYDNQLPNAWRRQQRDKTETPG